jgi:4-amino-4-deoxy-L-arabinose transferase-like glycosyltransferase/membrane-associated phospholipid phosphatase
MQNTKATCQVGFLLAAAIFLVAAVAVFPFDDSIAAAIRKFTLAAGKEHPFHEALAFFRPFGKGEVTLLIACVLGVCGARRRATQMILSLLLVTLLVWPLKLGVGRERPNHANDVSFPSGDAATIAALCTPLVAASPWSLSVGAVVTAGVAIGRVYDSRHFPSDVLAGVACGVLAGAMALALLRRRRFRLRRTWCLLAGLLILIFDFYKLPHTRVLPYALAFLGIWGPVVFLVMAAAAGPALWRARRRMKRRSFGRSALLTGLVAAVLALYFLLTTASTLWDRDEPRFSRATVEMIDSGDHLVPTFNGSLRPDKPILIYWLMSVPVRLLGPSELACRMVAPLATVATGLLVVWAGAQIGGLTAGLVAFVCLTLSPLMAVSGTAATTDALLLACITAAICSFLLSWTRGMRPWHIVLLTFSLGGALLTKGPVGLVVPLLIIAAILLFVRGGAVRPRSYVPWLVLAVVAAVGIFLAWALPANAATNGEFLRRGLGRHVVERTVTPLESHGGKSLLFIFYYLPIILFAFFPWTLYLPRLFRTGSLCSNSLALPARRALLCWALPVIILMSVVATKLPHYILPAWPALAILSAMGALAATREGRQGNRTPAARIGFGLFSVAGVTLGLGLAVAPWCVPLGGARIPAVALGLLFLTLTGAAIHWYRRGRHAVVIGILALGTALILLSAGARVLPALERFKISPRVAACINRQVPPPTPVVTCGYTEPSLTFYLGNDLADAAALPRAGLSPRAGARRPPIRSLDESDLAAWIAEPGAGVLVITGAKLKKYAATPPWSARLHSIAEFKGFNYSQGRWVTVIILRKDDV